MRKKTKKRIRYFIYFVLIALLIYIKFYKGVVKPVKHLERKSLNSQVAETDESSIDNLNLSDSNLYNTSYQNEDDTSSDYGFLYGYVTDKFGNPAQNIAVELFPMKSLGMPTYFGKTKKSFTDKDGMYKFNRLNPGFYYFLMFSGKDRVHVGAGDKIRKDFQLSGGGSISGKVTDLDGNPVFPAIVYALGMGWRYREVTETDETGAYKIYGLPSGKYFVAVRAEGYAISDEKNVELEEGEAVQNVDFKLANGCVLMGFIKNRDGEPQEGVYISTLRDPRKLGTAFTKSDKNGFYKLENLSAGVNYFVLWKEGSYIRRVGSLLIKEDIENRKDFIFDGTSSIEGTVVAKDYDFIKNPVSVLLYKFKKKRIINSTISICDENGNFKFKYLEPGKYKLRVSRCSKEYIKGADKTLFLDEDEEKDVNLELLKGGMLKIKLVDENGNPVSKVSVFANTSSGKVGFKSLIKPSNEKGEVLFSGMAQGKWNLEIRDKNFEPVKKIVDIAYGDEKELMIVLKKGIVVSGTVLDKNGNPLPFARIICRKIGDSTLMYIKDIRCNGNGNFKIPNLKEGKYIFFVMYRVNRHQTKVYNHRYIIKRGMEELIIRTNFVGNR